MTAIATHPAETKSLFAELDYRDNDGIEVSLLWNRADNSLSVHVYDSRSGDHFEVAAPASHAREVFTHPYVFAASVGATASHFQSCREGSVAA